MFRPSKFAQMNTSIQVQTATTQNVLGQTKKTYIDVPYTSVCNWSSYSSNERDINNIVGTEESATLTLWFDPAVKTDGRIIRLSDNQPFEIISAENVEQRNQIMIVRVRAVKGNA